MQTKEHDNLIADVDLPTPTDEGNYEVESTTSTKNEKGVLRSSGEG